jgi:hypothetical protein
VLLLLYRTGTLVFADGQGNQITSPARIIRNTAAVYVTQQVLLPNNAFPSIQAAAAFYEQDLSTLTGVGSED